MLLDLYFHQQNSAPRSGVSRMWLAEFYTREWELKKEKLKKETAVAEPTAAVVKLRKPSKKAIQAKVDKAEKDIEALVQGVADIAVAQQFTLALIQYAQRKPEPEPDFLKIAADYRKRIQQDDAELLLLSVVL